MTVRARGWFRFVLIGSAVVLVSCAGSCRGPLGGAPEAPTKADPEPAAQPAADPQDGEPAATPLPNPICTPGATRCRSLDALERCDGATWSASSCEGQCVGRSCASLPQIDQVSDGLLALGGDGWINAWALASDVPRGLTKAPSAAVEGLSWAPLCGADPLMEVIPPAEKRRKKAAYAVAATAVFSPAVQTVWFKASARGDAHFFVNGREALHVVDDSWRRPIPDARARKVELRPGRNDIVVWLAQEDRASGAFQLRLHGMDGEPAAVLAAPLGAATQVACPAAELVDIGLDSTPVAGGFRLAPNVSFPGLRPAQLATITYSATVDEADSAKGDASVHDVRIAPFVARLPAAAEYTFRIDLGPVGTRSFPLRFHGPLHERIVALAAQRDGWTRPVGVSQGSADSWSNDIDVLIDALRANEVDAKWLGERTQVAEEVGAAHAAGRDGYAGRTGVIHRAYRSTLDGKLQPYAMFVPTTYEGEGELPLVVVAHGLNNVPEHALRAVVGFPRRGGQSRLEVARYMPDIPDQGTLVVAPWAFGDNGQRLLGERDVLDVIEEVRRSYDVDPRRITLTGYSLGGTVAFTLPVHYPDLLAQAVPLCGYPNLFDYKEVRGVKNRRPWEKVMLEKRYLVNYAENGRYTPLWIIHGGRDQPQRAAGIADAYERFGYKVEFDVQEELGHNVWDYAYDGGRMIEFLKKRKRVGVPSEVRLTTAEYRYNRAFWVTVLGIPDYTAFGRVEARWQSKSQSISVHVRNVDAVALEIADLDAAGPVTIEIAGTTLTAPAGTRTAWLEDKSGWRLADAPPVSAGKRPGVAGPLDDAQVHPSLVVYGTQIPAETATNRLAATWHAGVNRRSEVAFPIKADVDVTPEDLRTHTVILVGRPETNRVAAQATGLPVQFDATGVTVRGKRHEGSVGVSLIFPSPWSKSEYVVLHAGTDVAATLASRNLPEIVPDYLVYDADGMSKQVGLTLLDERTVRDGGFFDRSWR